MNTIRPRIVGPLSPDGYGFDIYDGGEFVAKFVGTIKMLGHEVMWEQVLASIAKRRLRTKLTPFELCAHDHDFRRGLQ